ncbi:MAG: MFS transporter [Chloroflexi bacterium]|nr:MFS transporter [Chloroflexota bacterium]
MTSLSKNNSRFHYAFVIAAVTFFALLVGAGTRNVSTVLIAPLEKEFAWSRSNISFAVAISILWFGLGAPLAGSLVDRFGAKRVMLVGLSLIASGLALMLGMTELWMFHLLWGTIVGIGTGMMANVLGATIAHKWFNTHRGMIVGLFGATSAAGQLIFLPLLINLTVSQGWRGALTVVAIIVASALIPVLLFMRDDPAQVKTLPYGSDGTRATADTVLVGRRTSFRACGSSHFVARSTRHARLLVVGDQFFYLRLHHQWTHRHTLVAARD